MTKHRAQELDGMINGPDDGNNVNANNVGPIPAPEMTPTTCGGATGFGGLDIGG